MEEIIKNIHALFFSFKNITAERIEKLPQSGSDRIYFRIYTNQETFIATYNLNIKENKTFIHFSRHFKSKQLPVPDIYCVNEDHTIYIQDDL